MLTLQQVSCIELQMQESSRFVHFIYDTALGGGPSDNAMWSEDPVAYSSTDLLRHYQQNDRVEEYGDIVHDESLKCLFYCIYSSRLLGWKHMDVIARVYAHTSLVQ